LPSQRVDVYEYDPDEDWSPASWLTSYASVLYNEYLDYWELQNVPSDSSFTPEQRQYFAHLEGLARDLVPCLHSLSVGPEVVAKVQSIFRAEFNATKEVDDELAAVVTRLIYSHPIIRDGVRIDLALQAADVLLPNAEKRAADLIALIAHRKLSERAAAFLDRATRLYLWGFEPESVVLCASVLEAAYETRFSPMEMFRLQIVRKGTEYEPHEYEQAALAAGIFTKADKDLAARIRRARNDTIHNAPNTTVGAIEALQGTATLLDRLFPPA
jgi:hypothetical protein